jgi:hypothetical protein
LQGGESANYLPTKNFKITVNPDDVIKNGVIPASMKDKIAPVMEWKYTSNFVTKDNLAMLDILAHNDWKRPVYFAVTVGSDNMIGLEPYLFKEGFAYHLMPFKTDTANKEQLEKSNTMVMYNNMMNTFKWGNMKNAKYLDHESTTMFYPLILSSFANLSQNLLTEGHPDLANKALHKCLDVMPDIYPEITVAGSKNYMARTFYQTNEPLVGNKIMTSIDDYLVDQLNYNYSLVQKSADGMDQRMVQYGLYLLNDMATITKQFHQTALSTKYENQLKDYEAKFSGVLNQRR